MQLKDIFIFAQRAEEKVAHATSLATHAGELFVLVEFMQVEWVLHVSATDPRSGLTTLWRRLLDIRESIVTGGADNGSMPMVSLSHQLSPFFESLDDQDHVCQVNGFFDTSSNGVERYGAMTLSITHESIHDEEVFSCALITYDGERGLRIIDDITHEAMFEDELADIEALPQREMFPPRHNPSCASGH
jgi:hypothetical protein